MTAGDKHCLCNIWNLEDLIQTELSKKLRTFCWIFSPYLKYTSTFRHFEKKDNSHGLCISENAECQSYI